MDTEKKKLTDQQLRVFQIVAGVVSAVVLFLSIYMPTFFKLDKDNLLNYTFVAVFLVIMMGRRSIENKFRLRLNLFSLSLMDGVLGSIIVFAVIALYTKEDNVLTRLDNTIKILIIAGMIVILALGIVIPIIRYNKRKANGTVIPIRLPEKPEPAAGSEDVEDDPNRPLSIEEKIAAMSRELDEPKPEETDKEEK